MLGERSWRLPIGVGRIVSLPENLVGLSVLSGPVQKWYWINDKEWKCDKELRLVICILEWSKKIINKVYLWANF
jgi:hypothetical protein